MKNKFIMFFAYSLFFSVNGYCQFNTVLQKKDIPKAEPVLATTENKLIEEKEKAVVVNDALTSIYGHLYSVLVNAKQAVEAGQPIGISGSTGRSTGEHLHFQMEYKDKTIDPKPILDYINEVIRTVKGQISQQIDNELRRK